METELSAVFDRIRQERGAIAAIHSAFEAFPEGVAAHFDFYTKLMLADDLPLLRHEREWLAVETSDANQCPYCIRHHATALRKHIPDAFSEDQGSPGGRRRRQLLSDLANVLTLTPWKASTLHSVFLEEGFSEREWQHAVMIVSYFNFANRCAHAMALELEKDFETTCE